KAGKYRNDPPYDKWNTKLPYVITDTVNVGLEKPTVSIFATDAFAEKRDLLDPNLPTDPGTFTFSRGEGSTAGDLKLKYEPDQESTDGQAAVIDNDFSISGSTFGEITIPKGQSSVTITINAKDSSNHKAEWDKVIHWKL